MWRNPSGSNFTTYWSPFESRMLNPGDTPWTFAEMISRAPVVSGPNPVVGPLPISSADIRRTGFRCANQADGTTSSNRVTFSASCSSPTARRTLSARDTSPATASSNIRGTSSGSRASGSGIGRVSAYAIGSGPSGGGRVEAPPQPVANIKQTATTARIFMSVPGPLIEAMSRESRPVRPRC